MDDELTFSTRDEFRAWLGDNGEASGGVWLVFGKSGGPKTLKASEALEEAARYAKTLSHVRVLGLMTIPPVENEPQGNLPFFAKMKALYVDINQNIYDNKLKYLSMGMSGDYAEAIEAGSNMVRVGTAIFGARNYSK